MKLYHYSKKGNSVLQDGLLSFATSPNVNTRDYLKRMGSENKEEITKWLESCFEGRSRGIRFFTESIKWHDKALYVLKKFIDNCDLFSVDIDLLEKDGLIDAIYVSPSLLDSEDYDGDPKYKLGCDEELIKLNSINDIDWSPIDWSICDDETGRRFAFVRYYLIIVKGGIIPPKYLTIE